MVYGFRKHRFVTQPTNNTIDIFFSIDIFGKGSSKNEMLLLDISNFKKETGYSVSKLIRIADVADDANIFIYHEEILEKIHEKLFKLIINKI
jgi:hypothetical protein